MRVAVITPYFNETLDVLRFCHGSVRAQTHASTHFMVADGSSRPELSSWGVQHIVLANSHADVGNTPRAIGSLSAMNQGFDAIAYLDADNWYDPRHVETMIKLHQRTGAAVCTTTRQIHRLDGSPMFVDLECDGRDHVDTSCYFITKKAFRVLPLWAMMPWQLGPVADRVMWNAIRSFGLSCAHHPEPTVAFRSQYEAHYQSIGEIPPPGAKATDGKAWQWWHAQTEEVRIDWQHRLGLRLDTGRNG